MNSKIKLLEKAFKASVKAEVERRNLRDLIDNATYNSDYQKFKKRINDKNTEKAIVNDGYFTASELDSLELDSDWGEGDVIEEDDID